MIVEIDKGVAGGLFVTWPRATNGNLISRGSIPVSRWLTLTGLFEESLALFLISIEPSSVKLTRLETRRTVYGLGSWQASRLAWFSWSALCRISDHLQPSVFCAKWELIRFAVLPIFDAPWLTQASTHPSGCPRTTLPGSLLLLVPSSYVGRLSKLLQVQCLQRADSAPTGNR